MNEFNNGGSSQNEISSSEKDLGASEKTSGKLQRLLLELESSSDANQIVARYRQEFQAVNQALDDTGNHDFDLTRQNLAALEKFSLEGLTKFTPQERTDLNDLVRYFWSDFGNADTTGHFFGYSIDFSNQKNKQDDTHAAKKPKDKNQPWQPAIFKDVAASRLVNLEKNDFGRTKEPRHAVVADELQFLSPGIRLHELRHLILSGDLQSAWDYYLYSEQKRKTETVSGSTEFNDEFSILILQTFVLENNQGLDEFFRVADVLLGDSQDGRFARGVAVVAGQLLMKLENQIDLEALKSLAAWINNSHLIAAYEVTTISGSPNVHYDFFQKWGLSELLPNNNGGQK